MPDHVHAVFRIRDASSLQAILHSIKGYSGRRIRSKRGANGRVWAREGFDHVIRHEEEWKGKILYVYQNAARAGLVSEPASYPWVYVRGLSDIADVLHLQVAKEWY